MENKPLETSKLVKIVLKIETKEKYGSERLTTDDFPPAFSKFKEGSWKINESKALAWMGKKVKIKEFDISDDDRPKISKNGD